MGIAITRILRCTTCGKRNRVPLVRHLARSGKTSPICGNCKHRLPSELDVLWASAGKGMCWGCDLIRRAVYVPIAPKPPQAEVPGTEVFLDLGATIRSVMGSIWRKSHIFDAQLRTHQATSATPERLTAMVPGNYNIAPRLTRFLNERLYTIMPTASDCPTHYFGDPVESIQPRRLVVSGPWPANSPLIRTSQALKPDLFLLHDAATHRLDARFPPHLHHPNRLRVFEIDPPEYFEDLTILLNTHTVLGGLNQRWTAEGIARLMAPLALPHDLAALQRWDSDLSDFIGKKTNTPIW